MAEGNSTPESPPPPINTKSQESSVASASEALVPAEVVAKPPIAQTEEITEQEGGLLGDRLTKKAQDRLEQDWETKLADLADATATIKLRDVAERWSKDQDNIYLQMLGTAADTNQAYKDGIQQFLKQRYPSGYVRVYRGNLSAKMAGLDPLEREYVNVTASQKTAKAFAPTNEVSESLLLGVKKSVVIRIEDVDSIGKVRDSELIVPSRILKERIANPVQIFAGAPAETVTPKVAEPPVAEAAQDDIYRQGKK